MNNSIKLHFDHKIRLDRGAGVTDNIADFWLGVMFVTGAQLMAAGGDELPLNYLFITAKLAREE
jgi:hypothetical protein